MRKHSIDKMNDQQIIETFRLAAQNYERGIIDGEVNVSNKSFKLLQSISSLLKDRGHNARLILEPLMEDPDEAVRYLAAHNLLAVLPERARAVIEAIAAKWTGAADITIYARDTIENLDSGFYKPT